MAQGFLNSFIASPGSNSQMAVSTTTTLTSAAFGKQVVANGSSAYTITLPSASGNAGKYIPFQILTSSNALVTISPAAGTIQLQSTFILGSGESCWVYCDGTNWWVENLVLMPVQFQVGITTNQSLSASTYTILQFTNNSTLNCFDTNGFYSVSTYKYTPLYPGKFDFYSNIYYDGNTSGDFAQVVLFLNGTQVMQNSWPNNSSLDLSATMKQTIQMNGSTDYVTVNGYHSSNGVTAYGLLGGILTSYFSGRRINNF